MIQKYALVGLTVASIVLGSQSDSGTLLETKIRRELDIQYYDEGPPLLDRVLKLGEPHAVSRALLDLATRYRSAGKPGPEYAYRRSSVFLLGKLKERLAIPLLTGIINDAGESLDLKTLAIQSVGEIDPLGNESLLLALLHESSSIRYTAAEALSKTDDPIALRELEVAASQESDRFGFRRIQNLADAMRARINAK